MIKSNERVLGRMPEETLQWLAKLITVNCVRNTIIEDYHARGSLSQEDMKKFNQEVVNKIYTFLHIYCNGSKNEAEGMLKGLTLFYPSDWDTPVFDDGIKLAGKLYKEYKNMSAK